MEIWILLADTRKKLLNVWMIFAAFILGLFLLMTFVGKFEDIEGRSWLWLLTQLLPMLTLLFIGVTLNPQPSKVIKKTYFQTVFYGAIAYLLLVLMTLMGMQLWLLSNTEGSILDYFQLSCFWLLPFQAVLLVTVYILYFQNTKLLQANEKILLAYAQKKAEHANRFGSLVQKQAFDHLLKNDYSSVFDLLEKNLTDKDDRNMSVVIKGQFSELNRQTGFGTLEPAEAQRVLNRITLALIEMIEKV
jgi:hypothetical protein